MDLIELTCKACHTHRLFNNSIDAFEEGWELDGTIICDKCSNAPHLLKRLNLILNNTEQPRIRILNE